MIACRYISGDSSSIGEREFDAVGQRAVFSETSYREAVLGGAGFIAEEQFKKLGFTQEELDKYGPVGERNNPSASFCDKLLRAQEVYRETRDAMLYRPADIFADSSSELVDA